jgi:pyruvate formate lyase activating enzyme
VNGVDAFIAGKPILSTTDWPSKVCCVIFFVGCNLRCRFCFNTPLLEFSDEYKVDVDLVYPELETSRFLIDGIIATGGEPSLQPEALKTLAEWAKQQDLEFGLMTNGTRPDVIRQLLELDLVDYVAVDIKTVPDQNQYVHITQSAGEILNQVKDTVNLLKSTKISYEFRTTLIPSLVDTLEQLEKIRKWVGAKHYVLQNFRPEVTVLDSTLTTSFSDEQLETFRKYAKKYGITTRF